VSRRELLATAGISVGGFLAGCVDSADIVSDSDETTTGLTTEWTSETAREYEQNHHKIAVTTVDGETTIGVPLNEKIDVGNCGVFALDGEGELRWKDIPSDIECEPHSIGDMSVGDVDDDGESELLVAMKNGPVRAYDPIPGDIVLEASLIETVPYGAPVITPEREDGTRLFVAVDNGGTIGAATLDGEVVWTHDRDGSTYPSPLLEDVNDDGASELVVTSGGAQNSVTALDLQGTVVWQTELDAGGREMRTFERQGQLDIVLSTWSGNVVAIDGATGEIRWTTEAAYYGEVGDTDSERIYATAQNGVVNALDPADGSLVWAHESFDSDGPSMAPTVGSVTATDATDVIFFGHDGTAGVLDGETGEVLDERQLGGHTYTPPTTVDLTGNGKENVLALLGDGRVMSLSYHE
jgi:outer membrane protein assembly factor BamB